MHQLNQLHPYTNHSNSNSKLQSDRYSPQKLTNTNHKKSIRQQNAEKYQQTSRSVHKKCCQNDKKATKLQNKRSQYLNMKNQKRPIYQRVNQILIQRHEKLQKKAYQINKQKQQRSVFIMEQDDNLNNSHKKLLARSRSGSHRLARNQKQGNEQNRIKDFKIHMTQNDQLLQKHINLYTQAKKNLEKNLRNNIIEQEQVNRHSQRLDKIKQLQLLQKIQRYRQLERYINSPNQFFDQKSPQIHYQKKKIDSKNNKSIYRKLSAQKRFNKSVGIYDQNHQRTYGEQKKTLVRKDQNVFVKTIPIKKKSNYNPTVQESFINSTQQNDHLNTQQLLIMIKKILMNEATKTQTNLQKNKNKSNLKDTYINKINQILGQKDLKQLLESRKHEILAFLYGLAMKKNSK